MDHRVSDKFLKPRDSALSFIFESSVVGAEKKTKISLRLSLKHDALYDILFNNSELKDDETSDSDSNLEHVTSIDKHLSK